MVDNKSEKRTRPRIADVAERTVATQGESPGIKSLTPYKEPKQPLLEFADFGVFGMGNPQAQQMDFARYLAGHGPQGPWPGSGSSVAQGLLEAHRTRRRPR
jgi:hypothetical protein